MTSTLTLLDGGMGHLLKQRGVTEPGVTSEKFFLAGALANLSNPGVIKQAHREYIAAGAQIITTNNFVVTPWTLASIGREHQLEELTQAAALLAREAAVESSQDVKVAGSLPPLQDCYQVKDLQEAEQLQPVYEQLAACLTPLVDLIICETLASVSETWAAASAASASGLPFWVAWTLEDRVEHPVLRSGETIQQAVHKIAALPGLQAVLLNCCAPQVITAALPLLRQAAPAHLRIGAYGNGFRQTTSEWLSRGHKPGIVAPEGDYEGHLECLRLEDFATTPVEHAGAVIEDQATYAGAAPEPPLPVDKHQPDYFDYLHWENPADPLPGFQLLRTGEPGPAIGTLVSLRRLSLRGTPFDIYRSPDLGNLSNLTVLDMSECAMLTVPEFISRLTALRELSLTMVNDDMLPDEGADIWQVPPGFSCTAIIT
ncbi:hypothetical protein WJX72_008602 [[Myrmecia] bisecta]|uniref:Hcy-binding domain-containing protein n=1 Tax=[Myrmecia] bisecta TaxID=41462 RepID=A0AAW1R824_9CHLO